MSASRKRAAILKAEAAQKSLSIRLGLSEARCNILAALVDQMRPEIEAWRRRFPEHEYRRQDDCVSLKADFK